jgi:hypothetical protein
LGKIRDFTQKRPFILIDGTANWVLQTKALGYSDYQGTASSYAQAALLGLPLVTLEG